MGVEKVVDLAAHPIGAAEYRESCRAHFRTTGVLALPGFLRPQAVDAIRAEGEASRDRVFARASRHTVYLSPPDPALPETHVRNRLVCSSKGCLTDDQIAPASPLRRLYDAPAFREFLCKVLGEQALFPYADPLSSINLHFAETGQELGWHFDNSSFAITLMIQPAEAGGVFEYVPDLRDADRGDMGYDAVAAVLDGRRPARQLAVAAGTLLLFRGRNSLHRVTPNRGARTRMLAVLAYNTEPGVALSPNAQRTFYGRVG